MAIIHYYYLDINETGLLKESGLFLEKIPEEKNSLQQTALSSLTPLEWIQPEGVYQYKPIMKIGSLMPIFAAYNQSNDDHFEPSEMWHFPRFFPYLVR